MKRIAALLCMFAMVLSLCSCGEKTISRGGDSDNTKVTEKSAGSEFDPTAVATTAASAAEDIAEATEAEDADGLDDSVSSGSGTEAAAAEKATQELQFGILNSQRNFDNHRAWVQFRDDNNVTYNALIDEEGNAKFIEKRADSKNMGNGGSEMSALFIDGYTAMKDGNNGYYILDQEGNVSARLETDDQIKSFTVDTYSQGVWIVRKNVSSFAENADFLFFMNSDGTSVGNEYRLTDPETKKTPLLGFDYMDDGLFFCKDNSHGINWIADVKEGTFNPLPEYDTNTGKGYNGTIILIQNTPDPEGKSLIFFYGKAPDGEQDDFLLPIEPARLKEFAESCDSDAFTDFLWSSDYYSMEWNYSGTKCNEGIIYDSYHGHFDYKGNKLYDYPAFPDGVKITAESVASGGYIILLLEGADGKYYITIVDKNGDLAYEPLCIDDYCTHNNFGAFFYRFCNGYIDIGDGKVITPEGEIIDMDGFVNFSPDLKVVYNALHHETVSVKTYFSNGYGLFDNKIMDWKGNLITDKVTITPQTVNSDLIYSTLKKDEPQQAAATQAKQILNKDYKKISNFSIKGKWKNVGEHTFGQAQKGAIIAFDGTNCNYFSPKDTYAISKDGDNYKLECTSLMSTDTLTFTVRTVDKDTIDIYYGADAVELVRVE